MKLRSKLRGTRLWLDPTSDDERETMQEELMGRCQKILNALQRHRFYGIFANPVDPSARDPDYPEVMNHGSRHGVSKLRTGEYKHPREFEYGCRLLSRTVKRTTRRDRRRTPWAACLRSLKNGSSWASVDLTETETQPVLSVSGRKSHWFAVDGSWGRVLCRAVLVLSSRPCLSPASAATCRAVRVSVWKKLVVFFFFWFLGASQKFFFC